MSADGSFNKSMFYLKGLFVAGVVGYVYFISPALFARFKDWAMGRKAVKMIGVIEQGFCFDDGKCTESMASSRAACASYVTAMRSDKAAPDFSAQDRRLAIGCMHKGYMAHGCSLRPDEKKKNDCLERIGQRHDKCFDYTWSPEVEELPKNYGSGMVGCLYGVLFVQDDSAGPGISVQTDLLKTKKKLRIQPIDPKVRPSKDEVDELKGQLSAMGEKRIENFNAAMDALQAGRGGAAVDDAEPIDASDRSGKSALKSAGFSNEDATAAASAHELRPGEKAN